MLLWIICAVLTAVALAAVLRPLLTSQATAIQDHNRDPKELAVYRDQLAELESDLGRGVIGVNEAELSRREIARRMLRVADPSMVAPQSQSSSNSVLSPPKLGILLAAALPIVTLAGYVTLGSPGLPGRPFTERKIADVRNAPLQDLIVKVEAQLAANPGDGKGWDVIAPVYFRLDRFDEAAHAFQNAARLLGETTNRLAGFAEATVMASNGIVARASPRRIRKIECARTSARRTQILADARQRTRRQNRRSHCGI